jgi:hypothetical protein
MDCNHSIVITLYEQATEKSLWTLDCKQRLQMTYTNKIHNMQIETKIKERRQRKTTLWGLYSGKNIKCGLLGYNAV